MGLGEAMDAVDEQNEKKNKRKPRPSANGAATMTPKKRGRPKQQPPVIGTTWDLVLTKGKRGRLTLPPGMTKDDVEAVQMQIKPIIELSTLQAGIEEVG